MALFYVKTINMKCEISAIRLALIVFWDSGFPRIIMESDSHVAFRLGYEIYRMPWYDIQSLRSSTKQQAVYQQADALAEEDN